MFRVENADFIADKLSTELLPNQEFREVVKNALEAVDRRMHSDGSKDGGRIELDVDWSLHASDEAGHPWFLACSDNGDGMSRSELEKYTTTLAVLGAGGNQSIRGNQGMGLKISGPTRHKKGILIRSRKNGEQTMVQVGWDGRQYGLIPVGQGDEVVTHVPTDSFPEFIARQGAGTVVTFLGNRDGDNTFQPPGNPRGWLFKYLNTRFFRLSDNGIEVLVRVPTGGEEDWPQTYEDAQKRMRKEGRSFNLSVVYGTAAVWDKASNTLGPDWHGTVRVAGDLAAGIPHASIHWWVLPSGPGTDVSSRTASGGSLAVLFDNELHDWRIGNQANPYFARMGVLFGKTRIAFVIEPHGPSITSDFARAHVLVGGTPALQSEAWLQWAEQFRAEMPEKIKRTIQEELDRLEVEDPDRAKRIRERLRDVMQLLRPRFFRRRQTGPVRATAEVTGAASGDGIVAEFPQNPYSGGQTVSTGRGRGIGAVLSQVDDEIGEPASEVSTTRDITPQWVTEQEADGFSIVKGNSHGLRDRAAALAGNDGRTAVLLLLNREFRGFQAILAAMNTWANPEGDDDKTAKIKAAAEEWVEQKMIEAVQGLRQLENGRTWITEHYDEAMSPVSLTAAFMADRYHTLYEVKRAIGSLRDQRRTGPAREVVS